MVFEDAENNPGHLDQWFPSCGAYAIMIDDRLFQSDVKKKAISCLHLHKILYAIRATITAQGGERFPVPEHGSAKNLSDSYHTWFLP